MSRRDQKLALPRHQLHASSLSSVVSPIELRSQRPSRHFCRGAVDEVSDKRLQMHFGWTASRRIGKPKERHRDLVRGEPNRCTESRARPGGVTTLRVCAIDRTHAAANK